MVRLIRQILLDKLAAEKHKTVKMEWQKAKLQQAIDQAKRQKLNNNF